MIASLIRLLLPTLLVSGFSRLAANKNVSGTISSGPHHPTGNPQFVSAAAGNYHIQPSSAAFNAGVDAGVLDDINGQPRPYGPFPDIGFDEYWPTVVTRQASQ